MVQPVNFDEGYTGSVETITIGETGNYVIDAVGGTGGEGASNIPHSVAGAAGGAGAEVQETVALSAGDVIEIVVGGAGGDAKLQGAIGGGGGGGSFVYDETTNTLLEVAGGGGGGGGGVGIGGNAQAGTSGEAGLDGGGAGGSAGSGGAGGGTPNGAIFQTGGGGGGYSGAGGFGAGHGGSSFVGGSAGGPGGEGNSGGFGGGAGGGGESGLGGGGGGGGYSGGGGGLSEGGGGGGSFTASGATHVSIVAADNEAGNGRVTLDMAACYRRGTGILTTRGEIAVEHLHIGDRVLTLSGAERPVRWIGHRGIDCTRYASPQVVWPILIRAGAIDTAMPLHDLWVSPGHALLIDGALMQAEKLVNGASIVQVACERVEYWHVELESHDILIAAGQPAESYLDTGNRTAFLNGGACLDAFPDFRPRHWSATCVPLVTGGPLLARAQARLVARAIQLGFFVTTDGDAHVLVDGERVEPIALAANRLAFALPAGGASIELCSRGFVPAHLPASDDRRVLGVCVSRMQVDGIEQALDDEVTFGAWHRLERNEAGREWRWTRERTPLAAGTRLVVLEFDGPGRYWNGPDALETVAVAC